MNHFRTVVLFAVFAFCFVCVSEQNADGQLIRRSSAAKRKAIRSMHILDRPNRPFHFYGNTVRWLHHRRHGGR